MKGFGDQSSGVLSNYLLNQFMTLGPRFNESESSDMVTVVYSFSGLRVILSLGKLPSDASIKIDLYESLSWISFTLVSIALRTSFSSFLCLHNFNIKSTLDSE